MYWCMSAIITVMGSTVGFYGKLWVGGVVGVGDVDIDKAREGKVGGFVSLSWTEIVFEIGFLG